MSIVHQMFDDSSSSLRVLTSGSCQAPRSLFDAPLVIWPLSEDPLQFAHERSVFPMLFFVQFFLICQRILSTANKTLYGGFFERISTGLAREALRKTSQTRQSVLAASRISPVGLDKTLKLGSLHPSSSLDILLGGVNV